MKEYIVSYEMDDFTSGCCKPYYGKEVYYANSEEEVKAQFEENHYAQYWGGYPWYIRGIEENTRTKSILLSVQPQWAYKILGYLKELEIRKKFPKDFVGWVYIYCTKQKPYLVWREKHKDYRISSDSENNANGKVVGRFWCDKVEEINNHDKKILEKSCLTEEQLLNYTNKKPFYGVHINAVEIFDEPKELSEFRSCHTTKYKCVEKQVRRDTFITYKQLNKNHRLTKAPQNYCYIVDQGK